MIKISKIIKATIISLIVALLFVSSVCFGFYKFAGGEIDTALFLLNTVTISDDEKDEVSPIFEGDVLQNYPTVGTEYAKLKIESIDLELPVLFGASYDILKRGIAHDDRSYFPGQGGSIVMAGHNFKKFLARLPETKIGDMIVLETNYGTFNYQITDQKIIDENNAEAVPIVDTAEVLMLYTCWPINNIGHASDRYVVYADRVRN